MYFLFHVKQKMYFFMKYLKKKNKILKSQNSEDERVKTYDILLHLSITNLISTHPGRKPTSD